MAESAASYLYSTGPGKRAIWAQLLDELDLRGDEHVLDVGWGRGAVLMLPTRRLPGGRAVGADVWRGRPAAGLADLVRHTGSSHETPASHGRPGQARTSRQSQAPPLAGASAPARS